MFRIGLGTDIRKFKKIGELTMAGLEIPDHKGLEGQAKGDVVFWALGDALAGASGLGSADSYFPDKIKDQNHDSSDFLKEICIKVWNKGYKVVNVDMVILSSEPDLSSHREEMIENISVHLNIEKHAATIKFSSGDGLGGIGRGEAIMVQAVVLLEKRVV